MVSCELLVPQLFPCGQWISQAWHPLVIQIAELTGPLGVTALLMMVNGALYDLAVDRRAARYPALAAAALVGGGAHLRRGAHAPSGRHHRPRAALEGRLGAAEFCLHRRWRVLSRRGHPPVDRPASGVSPAGAGRRAALVWSEGSYPVALPRDFSADFAPESLGMIRRGFSMPVVVGADMYDAAHEDAFNSAILLDGDGRAAGRYDKVRLLAFGEYIPGIDAFPWLRKFLPAGTGRFTAGDGP